MLMTMRSKIKYIAILTLGISMLGSCGVYKKFELSQDEGSIVSDYAKAKEAVALKK